LVIIKTTLKKNKKMKTSSKTSSRFLGIAVVLMVLNLVTGNLSAQTSYNIFSLASLNNNTLMNRTTAMAVSTDYSEIQFAESYEFTAEEWMIGSEEGTLLPDKEVPAPVHYNDSDISLENWMMSLETSKPARRQAFAQNLKTDESEMMLVDWMVKGQDYQTSAQGTNWMNDPENWK
jgi:hypothetical protein